MYTAGLIMGDIFPNETNTCNSILTLLLIAFSGFGSASTEEEYRDDHEDLCACEEPQYHSQPEWNSPAAENCRKRISGNIFFYEKTNTAQPTVKSARADGRWRGSDRRQALFAIIVMRLERFGQDIMTNWQWMHHAAVTFGLPNIQWNHVPKSKVVAALKKQI